MKELQKLGVKLFAEPGLPPLPDFIPVFHRWIRSRALDDLLIDVADYSHVKAGPGVLLVAHEMNYSIDASDGRGGLAVYRKRPVNGSFGERLRAITVSALTVSRLLEEAPELEGRVRFRGDELLVFANDRLLAPNTESTLREIRPNLEKLMQRLYGDASYEITHDPDPKARFAVRLLAAQPLGISVLLDRIKA